MNRDTTTKALATLLMVMASLVCASGTDTLGVNITVLSSGAAPTISSVEILNSTNGTTFYKTTPLYGVANVSSANNSSLNLTYTFYLNGAANATGNLTNITQGLKVIVANVSTGLLKNQNWTFEITATDGNKTTSTNSSTVTISNSVPTIPVLQTPANASTNTNTGVNLTWAASTDADSDGINYTVCYGTPNPTTCTVTSALAYNISLVENQTYYWKVRAHDGTAYSDYSATRVFYTNVTSGAPPTITVVSTVPAILIDATNIGCSFIPWSETATVNLTYWMERGDGYTPVSGIKYATNFAVNVTLSNGVMLSSAYYTPDEFWRCGVNATNTFGTTTEYSSYRKVMVSTTSGGGSGYVPPPPAPIVVTQTTNTTQAAEPSTLPSRLGAYGITFSTASLTTPVVGTLMVAHFWLLFLLIILVLSFRFKKGTLRYAKYALMVLLALSILVLLPILSMPKV